MNKTTEFTENPEKNNKYDTDFHRYTQMTALLSF